MTTAMFPGDPIIIAFLMDLVFGDPKGFPHPVKGIGKASVFLEKAGRKIFRNHYLAGTVCVVIVVTGTYFLCTVVLLGCSKMNEAFGTLVSVFFIYTTLSTKSLYKESKIVADDLFAGQNTNARKSLAFIVGRDTQDLEPVAMTRACIETVSENTSDGITAPLFYAFIGGAPLAMTYKAINTLDSMFGYKTERYLEFGWAAAKLDDLANWVPARITGVFMVLSAFLLRLDGKQAFSIMLRDGQKHPSPNAGIPEAAMAGVLNIQLGGPSTYQGTLSAKPWIGDPIRMPSFEDIGRSHKVMFVSSILILCFLYSCFVVFWKI